MTADRSDAEQQDHLLKRRPTPIYQDEGMVEEVLVNDGTPMGLDVLVRNPHYGAADYQFAHVTDGYLTEFLDRILWGYAGSRVRVTIEDLGVPPYEPPEPSPEDVR